MIPRLAEVFVIREGRIPSQVQSRLQKLVPWALMFLSGVVDDHPSQGLAVQNFGRMRSDLRSGVLDADEIVTVVWFIQQFFLEPGTGSPEEFNPDAGPPPISPADAKMLYDWAEEEEGIRRRNGERVTWDQEKYQ